MEFELGQRTVDTLLAASQSGSASEVYEHEGVVREHSVHPGTLSEYRFYVLELGGGGEIILLKPDGRHRSEGFGGWVGITVLVAGRLGSGVIGFRNRVVEGFLVTAIREADS